MKNIFILGSTGSIGTNTLDVVHQHPGEFTVKVLVTNQQTEKLAAQIKTFKPECAVIFNEDAFQQFQREYDSSQTILLCGESGIQEALDRTDADIFVNAFVGFAGLIPTISAIQRGMHIALANKETLVVAGNMVKKDLKKYGATLYPVDSEHSAIWQCIVGEENNPIKRIILTASGGPFWDKPAEELTRVTPREALKHPNWSMGEKITIDSATLMNKGLEVIEAFWLYDVSPGQIEVVIHPQSIIHSMVEFEDNSIKAQLGIPDMRIPIQYALSYPQRLSSNVPRMDFNKFRVLQFEQPDMERFPCLALAYTVLESGKSYSVVLNASNEIAVDAFLNGKIKFNEIPELISMSLDMHQPVEVESIDTLVEIDHQTRKDVKKMINRNK